MRRKHYSTAVLLFLIIALLACPAACAASWVAILASVFGGGEATEIVQEGATLTLAYSPEKEALLSELINDFNAQGLTTPQGQPMRVKAVVLDPDAIIEGALAGKFQAISPDSSLWLNELDRRWEEQTGVALVGETVRYAVSPVVIAMWEEAARSMGYPEKSLGWSDLLEKARRDPDFKWSHPSTASASGLLATLAEFYAGAGKTRGLTVEDVQRQSTLDYVAALEKTVRYYGEGEWAVIQRVLQEGPSYLDAFICQEQLVIYYNRQAEVWGNPKLVAIYPREGATWEDHPLALLETPSLTAEQRLTFSRFRDYLQSPEVQQRILQAGYRPRDLSIPLDSPDSPITPRYGADPTQPKTTLQIPSAEVVEVVRDVWWYTKRHTNVYLVVDTSGSMNGEKLENVKEALRVFVNQIKGDMERVGLIEFASTASDRVLLDELKYNRADLLTTIEELEAGGDTALLDAVNMAYVRLQDRGDRERINAIVVMTDGRENNSRIGLHYLADKIKRGNASGVPVVIFCIAYGDDADWGTLKVIAESSGGQVRKGDLETIRQLYKILSTYF